MQSYKYSDVTAAQDRLDIGLLVSHNEAHIIKEGWQMGLFEKEITNHEGFGPIIRVYGKSKAEAEALAMLIVRMVNNIEGEFPFGPRIESNGKVLGEQ